MSVRVWACFAIPVILVSGASAQIPPAERAALIALYNSTDGQNWSQNTDWLGSEGTECSWFGIYCSAGSVTTVWLSSNNLAGAIPPEMEDLGSLQNLNLYGNQLTGNIPVEIGNLASLTDLNLAYNQLNGSIPSELGDLGNLVFLRLAGNQLSGGIPTSLAGLPNLETLMFDSNRLTGSIPPGLGGLANLRTLKLSSNELSGSIPAEFGDLILLQLLHLFNNQIDGEIPSELGDLTLLRELHLVNNQLSGNIPPELGDLTLLENLSVAYNQLSGSIPPAIGSLANLRFLNLDRNQLTGTLPPDLNGLSNIFTIQISHNQINGMIPPEIGSLATLSYLGLSNNQLGGEVPNEIINLTSLSSLDICDNALFTNDPVVYDFLDSLQPGWADCQSVVSVNYVALGDSYSSGEGASDYMTGTDTSTNRCHRSANAYSRNANPFVEAIFGIDLQVDRGAFFACSGAETKNIRIGGVSRYGEIPQLEHTEVDSSTDLVTITIGGNDAQFADIIKWCMDDDFECQDYEVFDGWPLHTYLPYLIQSHVEFSIHQVLDQARTMAPNATILVFGYPQLLSSDSDAQGCFSLQSAVSDITPDEIVFLRSVGETLNQTVENAAIQSGVHFVPVEEYFEGHEVCTESPWINGIKSQSVWCILNKRCWNESFHPNELGHRQYAQAAFDYLEDIRRGGKAFNSNRLPENPPRKPERTAGTKTFDAPTLGDLFIEIAESPVCGSGNVVYSGQSIRVVGDGFQDGATVEVLIDVSGGGSIEIGTTTADSQGEIDSVVTIPTGFAIEQPSVVQASGIGENGFPRLSIEVLPVVDQPSADSDLDGVPNACDNCADEHNPIQEDGDSDDLGDACDPCPADPGNDVDADGLCGDVDPCPLDPLNQIGSNGLCLGLDGIFYNNFEAGDTSAWSTATP